MASPAGQFHPWRLIITFLAVTAGLFALVFFAPGSAAPKLGIDLQGGTRLTLTARTDDGSAPTRESMKLARDIMERRVNGSGVAGVQVQVDGSTQLVITVPGQDNLEGLTRSARLNIRPVVAQWVNPELVTSAETPSEGATPSEAPSAAPGDTSSATVAPSEAPSADVTESGQPLRHGERALAPRAASDDDAPSTTAPSTDTPSPTSTTLAGVEADEAPPASTFPDGSNPDVLTQPKGSDDAALQSWEEAASGFAQNGTGPTCDQIDYFQGLDKADKPLLACNQDGTYVYLLESTLIPGTEVKDATSQFDTQSGQGWIITVEFDSAGFKTWSSYTSAHYDRTDGANPPPDSLTAFTLDSEVLSAPTIRQPITTPGTTVSGSFTQDSSKALADSLKFGALPLAFDRQASQQVSAELGTQYLKAGLIAGGIGLALVVIYCLFYYRLLGLITILSLLLSGAMIYAVMVLLGRWISLSLDMAGIAGLIIAIGITADSFVVYFERIKDEVREGRTFRSSVPRGWTRAKRTILSADAVSFLSAAILYLLAAGDVKGFAFTLGLSTVLDLVVVFMVTHPLVAVLSKANIFSHPVWSGLGSVARAGREHRAATAQLQTKEA